MLVRFLFGWLSNVVALFVAAFVVPGIGYGDDFWVLFLAGLVDPRRRADPSGSSTSS